MLDDLVEAQTAPAERPVSSTRLGEPDDAEGECKASGRLDAVDVDQLDLDTMTELVTELAWRGLRGRPEGFSD